MVKRVAAPAEHYLITQGQNLVTQFGGETLSKFAVQKLLENKMTSRNFKAGLDFTDHHKAQRSREKLGRMVLTYIEKELAYLFEQGIVARPFVAKYFGRSDQLVISTFYDQAISRYIRRVERFLTEKSIPVRIAVTPYNYEADRFEINISALSTNRSTLNYYRLMFFLPQVVQFFKCLSKKAMFTNNETRTLNRSKRSGFCPTERAERDHLRATVASTTANRAGNVRRTGTVNNTVISAATNSYNWTTTSF